MRIEEHELLMKKIFIRNTHKLVDVLNRRLFSFR